jgi:hypothetical protein
MMRVFALLSSLILFSSAGISSSTVIADPLSFSDITITTGATNQAPPPAPALSVSGTSIGVGGGPSAFPQDCGLRLGGGFTCEIQTTEWVNIQYQAQANPGYEITGESVYAGGFVEEDASAVVSVGGFTFDGPQIGSGAWASVSFPSPVTTVGGDLYAEVESGNVDCASLDDFGVGYTVAPVATPEPSGLWLLGTSLLGMAWLTRQRIGNTTRRAGVGDAGSTTTFCTICKGRGK